MPASLFLALLAMVLLTCGGGGGGGGGTPIGFTTDMLTGKAFAQINEQDTVFDDWVIQFDTGIDTGTFDYWESEGTYDPVSGDATITDLTSGTGNWTISNGELIVDLPGVFNVTVTLQGETAEYIDVRIDDGSNPPENARLYKTNPYVEADVINHIFDYGTFDHIFKDDFTGDELSKSGPPQITDNFVWSIENGALKQTFGSTNFSYIGYRLFNNDPNIVVVVFDDTGAFNDVFPETYVDIP